MPEPSRAVFLSYASQDAVAARRLCDALRAAGVEVWFDQSELRGGDSWDRQIRERIHDCRLFIAVISANTEARDEGYFRREWKLAVDRTHDMADKRTFLVPVVIDHTSERGASVPEKFREVQWTRLSRGETSPAFVERVHRLLSPEAIIAERQSARAPSATTSAIESQVHASRWSNPAVLAAIALLAVGALTYLVADRYWTHPRAALPRPAKPMQTPMSSVGVAAAAFTPPPHSIAVLPFVNMSADREQEYFSDGLTEELLNSLAEINELKVAARTSAFSFKGKDIDIGTIARKLNVGSVLEGSVRRSGNTVRITAQLINAVTGYHLWSHTYDRNLGDVLKLESDIAGAVAGALKVSLLGNVSEKIELGGTRNSAAFDAYLRGRKAQLEAHGSENLGTAIAAYTDAITLDPAYALALASRSLATADYAGMAPESTARKSYAKAQADAQKAVGLAPDLAEAHIALAVYFEKGTLDFSRSNEEFERALALAPGNAQVLARYGVFAARMGRGDRGIAAVRSAVVLDPLNHLSHLSLGSTLYWLGRDKEALAALQDARALDADDSVTETYSAFAYYELRDFEQARVLCERNPGLWEYQYCLAVTYDKLGRKADAESMLSKMMASAIGNAGAYEYAETYAQWGNKPKALEWLDTAMRVRDPGLEYLKIDRLMDPLRAEPRFQAVLRELRFPD